MSDRRPSRLLVCGFGPFPGVADNPAGDAVVRLEAEGWAPDDAEIAYLQLPTVWTGAAELLLNRMRETAAGAVLILGVATGAELFRVEMRAVNKALTDRPDAVGRSFPRAAISPLGPAVARTSAPVQPMVAAIQAAGLGAYASSDAGRYLCNYTFYRALTETAREAAPPLVAFLHVPSLREGLGLDDIVRGAKAAAGALARTLSFGRLAEPADA
jgi:pyroglutamyl-peptidase